MKKIINKIYTILLIVVLIIAGLTALSALGLPKQFQIFVVQSGSMEPTIKTGSLIVVKPEKEYKKGDIITFKENATADINNPAHTITHRIVSVSKTKNEIFYQTKGDANKSPDFTKRPKAYVLGKEIISFPYLGYPVGYAKTPVGFAILIVIPATIIAYSEILNIKKEAGKILAARRKKEKNEPENS